MMKIRLMPPSCVIFLACLAISAMDCPAEVTWKESQKTIHCQIGDKVVHTQFDFKNSGPRSMTVTNIKTSCGCTTAEVEKRAYASGEKGSIDVTYEIGNQIGLQEKSIIISTDDAQHPTYMLVMYIYVPEVLKMSTRYVIWNVGQKPDAREINLSAMPSVPVKVLSVTSNNPNIRPNLKVLHEGTDYTIVLIPATTGVEMRSVLTVETDLQQDGHNRSFYAYADVRAAAVAPAVKSN